MILDAMEMFEQQCLKEAAEKVKREMDAELARVMRERRGEESAWYRLVDGRTDSAYRDGWERIWGKQ